MKNKTYETIDEAMKLTLKPQWIEYIKLMARGGAFVADGRALWEDGKAMMDEEESNLMIEGYELKTEGRELKTKGYVLYAAAKTFWIDAVRAEFGDIGVEWKYNGNKMDCYLENGEVYPGNIDYSQED